MIANYKNDQLIHKVVFKQDQDIVPKYTKHFDATALLFEMLSLEDQISEMTLAYDFDENMWSFSIVYETEIEEIVIKKIEKTKELAICSVSLAYYGGRQSKLK